jgi:hypothetical protein
MLPNRVDAQALPPPPGIIGSLRAGFDAIASNIGLILMPLGLDLLLWLGPRIGVSTLMQPLLNETARMARASGLPQADIDSWLAVYGELLNRVNLLALLRTVPIGVSSLMSGRMPVDSPLGAPTVVEVQTVPQFVSLVLVLTLLGWLLGGLYFQRVAALVSARPPASAPTPVGRAVLQTVVYSLLFLVLIWSIGLPALSLIYMGFAINSVLGQALLLFLAFLSLWLLVPVFFSPHGMFLTRQSALASFLGGFRLARFTLPTSSLFVLTVFLVGVGLNTLWVVPAEDSWLVLVGLLGHAFVTTALLTASFIYYRDMSAWVQSVLERLRTGMPTQAA